MSNDRIVIHIDMDAFFASVEAATTPSLRGKPIAVVGSAGRTVITTASYEARKFGVKTGMNKFEAKKLCPRLIFVIGNNRKYTHTSARIMEILGEFTPLVEPYSIDEAFMDVTGSIKLFKSAEEIARLIKKRIKDEFNITASAGIAPNKLMAKLASGMQKPDGLTVLMGDTLEKTLKTLPVEEITGIGPRMKESLNAMGIRTCGELAEFSPGLLRRRFGITGERLIMMAKGLDDSQVVPCEEDDGVKSIGHSTTLPKDVTDKDMLLRYLLKLSSMVGERARKYKLKGRKVALTVRYKDFDTFSTQRTLSAPTNDTTAIYNEARNIIEGIKLRAPVRLLGVTLSTIVADDGQQELFGAFKGKKELLTAVDSINSKFGHDVVTWGNISEGRLLEDKESGTPKKGSRSGVISPAWRPKGVRNVDVE